MANPTVPSQRVEIKLTFRNWMLLFFNVYLYVGGSIIRTGGVAMYRKAILRMHPGGIFKSRKNEKRYWDSKSGIEVIHDLL